MPAIMDDPASPTIYRVSGAAPFPDPNNPALPPDVKPRQVTLRDRQTVATVVPFASKEAVPPTLLKYLADQFAKEIEGGDTYPMIEPMPLEKYGAYWFQNFAAIMLLGDIKSPSDVVEGKDWSKECLGSFYIKPNYPGRSSHVCNAGFLVTDASRGRGVGRLMGESYLDWAPKLGYTYSVFNLVYETNVASCRIWDALGFKRIGRVKGCGKLKSYPDRLVDAIIYGRDLVGEDAEGPVSEDRFDKIKFYLKYGRYPDGSDRAEKSRLRSAATHYKLLDNDVLMLKGKEVISDPAQQMDIARRIHETGGHSGINKTTAVIADRHHWSRIKETVSDVIRLCPECKETAKASLQNPLSAGRSEETHAPDKPEICNPSMEFSSALVPDDEMTGLGGPDKRIELAQHTMQPLSANPGHYAHPSDIASLLNPIHPLQSPGDVRLGPDDHMFHDPSPGPMLHTAAHASSQLGVLHDSTVPLYHPIDPQIITQPPHAHHQSFGSFDHHRAPPRNPHPEDTNLPGQEPYDSHTRGHHAHPQETESFQALLHDAGPLIPEDSGTCQALPERDQASVDRDLDILIEHGNDDFDMDETTFDGLAGADKRDRQNNDSGDAGRSAKRRNWDSVVFDTP